MKRIFAYLLFFNLIFIDGIQAQNPPKQDALAENMLLLQRSYGGWSKFFDKKKVDYDRTFNEAEIKLAIQQKNQDDATIDNDATSKEIRYLLKAYQETQNNRYLSAVKRGVDYLIKAQYPNGGWPQYFPDKHLYRSQITYNDNAIINVLLIMQDIERSKNGFEVLGNSYQEKARRAIGKGISCILKTQVTINGKKTIWAAQYDKDSLQPAKARAYELPALATSESSDILLFLMAQPKSQAIEAAIEAGISWFDTHKIIGKEVVMIETAKEKSGKDRVLQSNEESVIWARFYDLQREEPLFVGRDGIPHRELSAIENERRIGYAWYGTWGKKLTKAYQTWKKSGL